MTTAPNGVPRSFNFFAVWFVIGVVLASVVVYFCVIPHVPGPSAYGFDKVEHATTMGFLTAWFGILFRRHLWLIAILIAVYGGLIEWLQAHLPGRDASFFDWMADCFGVALGTILVVFGGMDWLGRLDDYVGAKYDRARGRG